MDYAGEALKKIGACRYMIEKSLEEAPNVCSANSSLFSGMEAGMAIFPQLQVSYTKLGDLSLEMDHYAAKLLKVTTANEEATKTVELEPGNEKAIATKEKVAERLERNKQKLADATTAVSQCSDEFLQFCEDTEEHR